MAANSLLFLNFLSSLTAPQDLQNLEYNCNAGFLDPNFCCLQLTKSFSNFNSPNLNINFRYPGSYNKYYTCNGIIAYESECTQGQMYKNGMCVPADNSFEKDFTKTSIMRNCQYGLIDPGTCCRQFSTDFTFFFKDPNDCQSYYVCKDRQQVKMKCPSNKQWSALFNQCIISLFGDCSPLIGNNNIDVNIVPVESNELETENEVDLTEEEAQKEDCLHGRSDPKECCKLVSKQEIGFMRNPENCNSYYECINKKAVKRFCPKWLHWSIEIDSCVLPIFAKCEKDCNEKEAPNVLDRTPIPKRTGPKRTTDNPTTEPTTITTDVSTTISTTIESTTDISTILPNTTEVETTTIDSETTQPTTINTDTPTTTSISETTGTESTYITTTLPPSTDVTNSEQTTTTPVITTDSQTTVETTTAIVTTTLQDTITSISTNPPAMNRILNNETPKKQLRPNASLRAMKAKTANRNIPTKSPKKSLTKNKPTKSPKKSSTKNITPKSLKRSLTKNIPTKSPKTSVTKNIPTKSPKKDGTSNVPTKSPKKAVTNNILTKSPKKDGTNNVPTKSPKKAVPNNILTKSPKKGGISNISTKSPKKGVRNIIPTKSPKKGTTKIMSAPKKGVTKSISTKTSKKGVTKNMSTKSPKKVVTNKKISTKSVKRGVTRSMPTKSSKKDVTNKNVPTKSPKRGSRKNIPTNINTKCSSGKITAIECCKNVPKSVDVFLVVPNDCYSYYHCCYGIPLKKKCPSGLQWNSKKNICDYSENVNCVVKQQSQNTPSYSNQYDYFSKDIMNDMFSIKTDLKNSYNKAFSNFENNYYNYNNKKNKKEYNLDLIPTNTFDSFGYNFNDFPKKDYQSYKYNYYEKYKNSVALRNDWDLDEKDTMNVLDNSEEDY